ncbi:MAG: ribbon-helix-helix protein, CopG family [Candidatus Bathyarchaeota archaeon]
MNKDKISITLTKKLIKQITTECQNNGLSRSSYIELIIRQHYKDPKTESSYLEVKC